MIIKFRSYSDDVHYINLFKSSEKLGLEEPFFGNVLLNCKMDKAHHQIILGCELTVNAKMTCDRCNESFETTFSNNFQSIFFFKKDDASGDYSNIHYLNPDSDKIDLTEEVIDYARLSIPLKVLCSEDCKGLCPKCGINLNKNKCKCKSEIKSVWEPLQKLKENLNK